MHYVYIILIGFVAGLIARVIIPGPNEPTGFVLTAALGIIGSLLANFVAEKAGWAGNGQGVGLLSGIVGAVVLLLIYHFVTQNRTSAV